MKNGYEEMDRFMEKADRAEGVRSIIDSRKKNRKIRLEYLSSMWDWVDKERVRLFTSKLGGYDES